ncbi:plasmid stabilization protein [Polymorphobacter multimanifer]|uniref:Toxin ParE1/3/4 n=1 Tax=Polymorphobacter multimanifer TaxID=1070431 RepID=A0A841L6Q1_9SPHN|nr:type II toxin-antitoxin system RelE/ParE family toxin [Polymorphobacter multimanifer]MBB6227906.1 toxin ParE1/3/4 [Polymorphobacter multimanifer]GGI83609.1 plasmid stabilization protein [Polymorphobacter multimanifer]
MAHIVRSPAARRDTIEIWRYVAQHDRTAADRLVRLFDSKLTMLRDEPLVGSPRPELATGLRSFVVGRYTLFYCPTGHGIELVRILHAARDIGSEQF